MNYANTSITEKEREAKLIFTVNMQLIFTNIRTLPFSRMAEVCNDRQIWQHRCHEYIDIATRMGIIDKNAEPFITSFLKIICQKQNTKKDIYSH